MKFERTGIILYTIAYEKCVEFYAKTLQLNTMFKSEKLTCFEFRNSYLMVELDDKYYGSQIESGRIKTCLRMNVQNVKSAVEKLTAKNVKVDYQEHSWGTVAKFFDPDGNLLAFKDSNKLPRGRAHEVLKFQKKQTCLPAGRFQIPKKKQNEAEPRGIKPEKTK